MSSHIKKLPPLFRIESILKACQNNTLIITANQRLSSKAIQAWGHYHQEQQQTSWQPPQIYSIDEWLKKCWQRLQSIGHKDSLCQIISSEQERIFWESITAQQALMQTDVLAQQAASAYKALQKWELTLDELNQYEGDISTGLLKDWFNTFEKRLASSKLITEEHSLKIIGDAYYNALLQTEPEILLIGFDDIPPLIQTQLDYFSPQVTKISTNDFTPDSLIRREFKDFDSEVKAATQWAKNILLDSKAAPPRIGIIVPNLGQCRAQIERSLINTFEGHSLLAKSARYTLPFNISAGIPLGKTPLFTDTFLLLKLNQDNWSIEDAYRLLFSPFWGAFSIELEARSTIVNELEKLGLLSIKTQELFWQIKQKIHRLTSIKSNSQENKQENNGYDEPEYDDKTDQDSFDYLESLSNKERYRKNRQLPSQWVDTFLKQLEDVNWPGERQPDSIEYQQTQLWYQLLESFAGLDKTLGSILVSEAISQLQSMANHQPFQAKVPDSPIQVLGILEGSGLHFSHCWVLGLHQQAWPPAPAPNPILPISLQRKYNMPHASSLRELQFAQSLTKNYKHCATNIVFSSAYYDTENEIELTPSQLIHDITLDNYSVGQSEQSIHKADNLDSYLEKQHQTKNDELIACGRAPKVNLFDLNQEGVLTGGANIIKSQSINPFDAFAKYRLKVRTMPQATMGFSAIDKGNILHLSLASLWQKIKTQKALLIIDKDELEALVEHMVTVEMNAVIKHKRYHFGKELCRLEVQRQTQLITRWLAYEKTRQPFSVISIEENHRAEIQAYTLQVRLDRVDEINNAQGKPQHLIIDYKTGQCSLNDWKGDRPNDPQLPFYLTINNSNCYFNALDGIAFAQINAKQQSLSGLHHEDSHIAEISSIEKNPVGLPLSWEKTSQEWSRVSNNLLNQFLSGVVDIEYNNNSQLNFSREFISLNRFYD